MPKKASELSPLAIGRLTRPGMHEVGGVAGLKLQVLPSGGRSWILRVTIGAKRREMGLGGFPDVTVAEAREKARQARAKIQAGIDPGKLSPCRVVAPDSDPSAGFLSAGGEPFRALSRLMSA